MEKKKVDLSVMAGKAGKNAKAFWGKAKDSSVTFAVQKIRPFSRVMSTSTESLMLLM